MGIHTKVNIPKFWIGSAIVVAMIVGAGTAYILKSPDVTITNPTSTVGEITITGYLIEPRGNKFVAVPVPVKAKNNQDAIATALNQIITTKSDNLYSAIPTDTKVLDLRVTGNDIYLNLSKQFTSGGGSDSMRGRLIQLLYTATSLNPNANLFLSVEGKPLDYLGGEGLEVSQPLRRQNFSLEF
ncbi:sporulation/spore germination protein [Synechococcus sp. PCC 7502]|uniref:GerMN domain-containing protein n=1 Tax=Synechococcus sp. PCC 7502 TaxID=1173263 RepID=UPI00029FA6F8|nr:GerMN domain-containing protein [Synechococcus sp. PCC 7502]AFY74168.1 sporulation/spore germination protein [Synechococcus sp. PCC 7502]